MANEKLKILGIAGSLRKGSYNRALLRAAKGLIPPDAEIEIFDLAPIPPFNQDEEMAPPAAVAEFKKKVLAADAILFVTPENNYSVPGVLKNAIDWASRPYGESVWEGKPAGIMSASISMLGGARAQYHLRQMFVWLDMHAMNKPEVMVASAQKKFDGAGNLTDEETKTRVREFLAALIVWTERLQVKT